LAKPTFDDVEIHREPEHWCRPSLKGGRYRLPSSLSADVTSQLHADSLVEADYQNAESDSSLGQMQGTLATVAQDSNAAGAATIILRRDLGLPPTS
jgi:hypothetical protein